MTNNLALIPCYIMLDSIALYATPISSMSKMSVEPPGMPG